MQLTSLAVAATVFAATCNASVLGSAFGKRQSATPGLQPAGTYITCRGVNPNDDAHPNTCGSKGTQTWLYCLNGKLCANIEGHGTSEDQFKQMADDDKCHCPAGCTTDGNGDCV